MRVDRRALWLVVVTALAVLGGIGAPGVLAQAHDRYAVVGGYWPPHFVILDGQTLEIEAEKFLHDGGWDASKRYFLVAANQVNRIAVVDARAEKLVTLIDVAKIPHPGRGATRVDRDYGLVWATVHLGEGRLWIWADHALNSDPVIQRSLCVVSKRDPGAAPRCWEAAAEGRAVHLEYDRTGREVWVSIWNRKDRQSEVVVYDDRTLEEKARLRDPRLITPTGKFNVYNTVNDIY